VRAVELPSPRVGFGVSFRERLARLLALEASRRERRAGEGSARTRGGGFEFLGYRPYRSGEDLRFLDWNLLARLGRPYVRVSAREAREEWFLFLDASASMGVGRPGKLQLAAELAVALAALAVRQGARARLFMREGDAPRVARKPPDLEGWLRFLEGVQAQGTAALGALAARAASLCGDGRWFWIGDFLDCEPREVLSLARPGRELFLAQILAREELQPALGPACAWIDAESGRELARERDPTSLAAYERALAARLEGWRAAASRARAVHACWTSGTPFETLVRALCARMG
jgi:uncharacterized protein (DUF58 family)